MLLMFEIFQHAKNHGKKLLKLLQIPLSGIVHLFLCLRATGELIRQIVYAVGTNHTFSEDHMTSTKGR